MEIKSISGALVSRPAICLCLGAAFMAGCFYSPSGNPSAASSTSSTTDTETPTTSAGQVTSSGDPPIGTSTAEGDTQAAATTSSDASTTTTDPTTSVETGSSESSGGLCSDIVLARSDRHFVDVDDLAASKGNLLENDVAPADREVTRSDLPAPLGMVVVGSPDGDFVYTAPTDGFGCDSFAYRVEAEGCSDDATCVVSLARGRVTSTKMVADGHAIALTDPFAKPLGSYLGHAVLSADFDRDGLDGLFAAALITYEGQGRLYAVDTPALLETGVGTFNVTTLCKDAQSCWHLQPSLAGWGHALASGDFDGDDRVDIVVGAPATGTARGNFTILYGDGLAHQTADLTEYAAAHPIGTVVSNLYPERFGTYLHGGLDFDADGLADIVVAGLEIPLAYVVFGSTERLPGDPGVDIATLVSTKKARKIKGASVFTAVHTAGDLNRDGHDDVLLGATGTVDAPGAVHVVFGRDGAAKGTLVDLTQPEFDGFTLSGEQPGDRLGAAIAGGGDLNGDSWPDIVLGAPGASGGNGAVYVIFGRPDEVFPLPTLAQMLAEDPPRAIRFDIGQAAGLGSSLAMGGDFNGDGLDDLAIGAPKHRNDPPDMYVPGAAFVRYGSADLVSGVVEGWSSREALQFTGVGYQQLPKAMALTGDHDGDGFADLVVSLLPGGSQLNTAWVIPGGCTNGRVSQIGTPLDDTLAGDDALDDVIVTGRGADRLTSIGDLDVALAGPGDDLVEISTVGFRRIDGGSGHDTLLLVGSGMVLDLTTRTPHGLMNIEEIDLGVGNTLIVDVAALARISTTDNTLRVRGAVAAVVGASELGGFVKQESADYTEFVAANTTLKLRIYPPGGD